MGGSGWGVEVWVGGGGLGRSPKWAFLLAPPSTSCPQAFPGQRIWLAAFANSTTIYGLATASDTDWDWNTTAHFVLYNFQTGSVHNPPSR